MENAFALKVEGLSLHRGQTTILDSIDWVVGRRECWVLLGANGAGKTSLLSALMAYMPASSGSIEVCGKQFGRYPWPELRKRIGLVSSSVRQRIERAETAASIVISGRYATLNHWGDIALEDREEAVALLQQLDCAYLAEREWGLLSQGERQRVLIARALMAHPDLLILDEPCSGLDPVSREHFLRFIQTLAESEQSPALVFVTHHVEEVMPAFTKALLLKSGKVLAQGNCSEVFCNDLLSQTYGASVVLESGSGRYRMQVEPL
ncbi:MAG: ATP-binding cassette domain-containing protein [Opitutales bacterium]|nr:ATP-binding cassette domain-containing protein [Opitutales bacterium]